MQGADLTQMADKTAPRVTIIHHPDVRRMLMLQKAYAEGMRALVLYTATQQDAIDSAEAAGADDGRGAAQRPAAAAGQGRRLGAGLRAARRSRCRSSAAPATCRTTRSSSTSGTPRSTPCTRGPPRSRASTCSSARSSGTRGGADRAGHRDRHVRRGRGRQRAAEGGAGGARGRAGRRAGDGRRDGRLPDVRAGGRPQVYKVGQNTTRLLLSLGDLVVGWLLVRSGRGRDGRARRRVGVRAGTGRSTRARSRRPGSSPPLCCPSWPPGGRSSENTDNALMDVPEASF